MPPRQQPPTQRPPGLLLDQASTSSIPAGGWASHSHCAAAPIPCPPDQITPDPLQARSAHQGCAAHPGAARSGTQASRPPQTSVRERPLLPSWQDPKLSVPSCAVERGLQRLDPVGERRSRAPCFFRGPPRDLRALQVAGASPALFLLPSGCSHCVIFKFAICSRGALCLAGKEYAGNCWGVIRRLRAASEPVPRRN